MVTKGGVKNSVFSILQCSGQFAELDIFFLPSPNGSEGVIKNKNQEFLLGLIPVYSRCNIQMSSKGIRRINSNG